MPRHLLQLVAPLAGDHDALAARSHSPAHRAGIVDDVDNFAGPRIDDGDLIVDHGVFVVAILWCDLHDIGGSGRGRTRGGSRSPTFTRILTFSFDADRSRCSRSAICLRWSSLAVTEEVPVRPAD